MHPTDPAAQKAAAMATTITARRLGPVVIYHHNCADGFSGAWCFHHHHRRQVTQRPYPDFIPGRYGDAPPDVTGRDVFLVDFSYRADQVQHMLDTAASVTLIDHHISAIRELQPMAQPTGDRAHPPGARPGLRWYCDTERSGATLAWDYLFPGEQRPLLLGHIEDRDLWRFKLPHTREIQAAVFSLTYSMDTWDKLMAADPHDLLNLTAQGAAIERKQRKDVAELVAACRRRMDIGGHQVWTASLPYTLASDAAGAMADGEPFAACYWDSERHRHFSLRSGETGLDVAAIAGLYGGGGHTHAAGFRVARDHELARA